MDAWSMAPPRELEAWEITIDGDTFVIFVWDTLRRTDVGDLTSAEREVLGDLVRGESNASIARRRSTSPRTVANQVASVFRKVGVHSRTELIAHVVRRRAPNRETK